jgi:NADH-quinone oxidoreductase subunit N
MSTPDFFLAIPELWVASMACVILVADLFVPGKDRAVSYYLSLFTLAVAAWLTLDAQWGIERTLTFSGTYVADNLAAVLKVAIYGLAALAFIYARSYLKQRSLLQGEFFVLGLFAVLGMMVISSAHSLLTIYMGLELLSLCLYAMVAFNRDSLLGSEAAMKYFVLGALSSGMLLYGMSMLYGVAGSLDLVAIATAGMESDSILFVFGLTFLVVGVAFKFGAVPFHMWVPDVYEGAPTPVALFIGTASKVASVALFLRLIAEGLGGFYAEWQLMLVILAVLSLIIGNLFAVVQTNFKRLLGYSTISHVGFILLGFIAGTEEGYAAALFYTITYAITAAAAFAIIILLSRRGFEADRLDDLKGLFQRDGWSAFVLLLLMFSMTGVPGTVGFYAKLLVLKSVVDVGMIWLAILAVVFAVVGAFYYLRVLKLVFFEEPQDTSAIEAPAGFRVVLGGNALAVLALGLFPSGLIAACLAAFG